MKLYLMRSLSETLSNVGPVNNGPDIVKIVSTSWSIIEIVSVFPTVGRRRKREGER
jgi:hypothetical protein